MGRRFRLFLPSTLGKGANDIFEGVEEEDGPGEPSERDVDGTRKMLARGGGFEEINIVTCSDMSQI